MNTKITLSVIKADVGGYVGHSAMHEEIIRTASEQLLLAQEQNVLIDFHVTSCGDDLELILIHAHWVEAEDIHHLAWNTFGDLYGGRKAAKTVWGRPRSPGRCVFR